MLALAISFAGYSQKKLVYKSDLKSDKVRGMVSTDAVPVKAEPMTTSVATPPVNIKNTRGVNYVNVVNIGTAANGYGYAAGHRSMVWADNDLNTVTNFHRMGGTLDVGGYSGDLGYDISVDGGMTWTNMVECYTATFNTGGTYYADAARYPNHGIYNPIGNTDPDNAYVAFFAPTLDKSNASDGWGGYTWGRARIGDVLDTTKHLSTSDETYYQYIPPAYDISRDGIVICVDINQYWYSTTLPSTYQGNLIINRGEWDEGLGDFVFERSLLDLTTVGNAVPAHASFAFSPDGQIGWLAVLCNEGSLTLLDTAYYYPVFFKTTDGGLSWSDPIPVQLDGPDGLAAVRDYLPDSIFGNIWNPPYPARDEIAYTSFESDLAVDSWGNPHLSLMTGVVYGQYSMASVKNSYGVFDIFTADGGTTWDAYQCGAIKYMRGTWPDASTEDNRVQIASTPDGDKMFVTWNDTRTAPGATQNISPDIYARGIDVNAGSPWLYTMTQDENGNYIDAETFVTAVSEAMWQSYMQTTSRYALVNDGTYTIPIAYQWQTGLFNPTNAVQFKYIQDFQYTDADFLLVGVKENVKKNMTSVSQNYPNPFDQTSTVQVNLETKANLDLVVTNLLGQQVMRIDRGEVPAGSHQFILDGSKLGNGIYFYTVNAGNESITHKMIVR
jgi:hypothetical protein